MRKQATQRRARDTIARILAAAAVELHTGRKPNTNRIAKRAGVSIGSLYQYFASADEILAALTSTAAPDPIASALGWDMCDEMQRPTWHTIEAPVIPDPASPSAPVPSATSLARCPPTRLPCLRVVAVGRTPSHTRFAREPVDAVRTRVARATQRRETDKHRKRRYGLDGTLYDALLVAQGGHCALCPATTGARYASKYPLGVDHDHASGRVRGLLYNACNAAVGMLGDTVSALAGSVFATPALLAYLRGPGDPSLAALIEWFRCGGPRGPALALVPET